MKKILLSKKLILCLLILTCSLELFARAGGGGDFSGGGSGGDSGGDGLFAIIWIVFRLIPFPYNIIVLGIIVVVYLIYSKQQKKRLDNQSVYNNIPSVHSKINRRETTDFPFGNVGDFKEKVKTAFTNVQYAWAQKNLGKVRHFISDGVYQRFNTQFEIMKQLEQTNTITGLQIIDVSIVNTRTENEYAVVDVVIEAIIEDQYLSSKYPQLNQGGREQFVEYWSFIRKKRIVKENEGLYASHNCPKCGDGLPEDAGEVAKCKSCGTMVNSGEYDWVLAEITQAADFNMKGVQGQEKQDAIILSAYERDTTFSIQMMEDKASNAFLQILTSKIKKNPIIARRFTSNEYYEKLESENKEEANNYYVRLYLNSVDLINGYRKDSKDYLFFNIKYTKQRVSNEQGKFTLIDYSPFSESKMLVMCRNANVPSSKGSLYGHSCPSCAGPINDTLDVHCQYCGNELNSPQFEWIVYDVISHAESNSLLKENQHLVLTKTNPLKAQDVLKIKDYVLNNVLIMLAADGKFTDEEHRFLKKLQTDLKFEDGYLNGLYNLAEQKKLSLIWPIESKDKKAVYELMEKAAHVDANLSQEEKNILEESKSLIA